MRFCGRIKSPQKCGHANFSEATEVQIIEMQRKNINTNVLQHLCTRIFKCRKINHSYLCVCCATIRLLLNLSNGILQRFTIIARFIGFSFHASPMVYSGYRVIFAPSCFFFHLRFCLVLNSPKQCCGRREIMLYTEIY